MFPLFPHLFPMIFIFWMLSFKPTFSLSTYTFVKRLFSSSSLSALRVMSSAYLRLLIFLLAVLILACASSSPGFRMMHSAYKLNKQGDNIQPWYTPFPEKAMAPHSSTLAWKIPWTEEPGRLQSMGLLRVGDDWATSLSLFTFMHWRREWQPTPVFLPGESQGRGSLVGSRLRDICAITQSRTRQKRLSNSSSSNVYSAIYHVLHTRVFF